MGRRLRFHAWEQAYSGFREQAHSGFRIGVAATVATSAARKREVPGIMTAALKRRASPRNRRIAPKAGAMRTPELRHPKPATAKVEMR